MDQDRISVINYLNNEYLTQFHLIEQFRIKENAISCIIVSFVLCCYLFAFRKSALRSIKHTITTNYHDLEHFKDIGLYVLATIYSICYSIGCISIFVLIACGGFYALKSLDVEVITAVFAIGTIVIYWINKSVFSKCIIIYKEPRQI